MRNLLKNAFPFIVLLGFLTLLLANKKEPITIPKVKQQCSGKCPSKTTNNGAEQLYNNPFKRLIVSL